MFEDGEDTKEVKSEEDRVPETAKQLISRVKKHGRRRMSAEDKVRIVMEGLRGEITVSDICRRERLYKANYYKWLKDFLEAGKRRLIGDHMREANTTEVQDLREENESLKKLLAEKMLEVWRLKKSHLE